MLYLQNVTAVEIYKMYIYSMAATVVGRLYDPQLLVHGRYFYLGTRMLTWREKLEEEITRNNMLLRLPHWNLNRCNFQNLGYIRIQMSSVVLLSACLKLNRNFISVVLSGLTIAFNLSLS